MPSAKSVAPYSGVSDSVTLATSRSIKPTFTPGDLVGTLLGNKNTSDDRKAYLLVPGALGLVRVMLFAAAAVDATVLSGETLIGTFVRDDTSKENSPHSFTKETGLSGDNEEIGERCVSLCDVSLQGSLLYKDKPSRSMQSLLNAIYDTIGNERLDGSMDPVEAVDIPFAVVVDQTSTGTIKVYGGATAGTLTGKLADVEQVVESDADLTSLW